MTVLGLLDSVVAVSGEAQVVDEIARLFAASCVPAAPTSWLEVTAVAGGYEARLDDGPPEPTPDADHAVAAAGALLNRLAVNECASFAVHAGVVAREGRVVAFPAESGVGKSTLTAALLTTGWDYLSDEALAVSDDLTARPYPRPLALHSWTLNRLSLAPASPALGERLVTAPELGAGHAPGGAVTDVLLVERGHAPNVVPSPGAAAASQLLRHAFNHYRDPERAVRTAAVVAAGASGWRVTVGDPVETALLLGDVLA